MCQSPPVTMKFPNSAVRSIDAINPPTPFALRTATTIRFDLSRASLLTSYVSSASLSSPTWRPPTATPLKYSVYSGSPSILIRVNVRFGGKSNSRVAKNAAGSPCASRLCCQIHCARPVLSKNLCEYSSSSLLNPATTMNTTAAMMQRRRMSNRSAVDGSRGPAVELESTLMKAVIVIPARWASSRFPGKPLAMIAGVSLIQRVYQRAAKSIRASAVFVATDDDRIADHINSFGGRFVRPEGEFQSGTDRIAASLDLLGDSYDQVINVQGDEPLIDVGAIDSVIEVLQATGV